MARTLYVGNLPWATTVEDLSTALAPFGRIEGCRIITDPETGRSRGFGFIEVADDDADRIISEFHGKLFGNRELMVNEARPRRTMDRHR